MTLYGTSLHSLERLGLMLTWEILLFRSESVQSLAVLHDPCEFFAWSVHLPHLRHWYFLCVLGPSGNLGHTVMTDIHGFDRRWLEIHNILWAFVETYPYKVSF